MFRSAVIRLTLSYLAILMAMSIIFSYLLYHLSNNQLSEELRHPSAYELTQPNVFLNFNNFRDIRLGEAQRQLVNNLILLNLGTLIVGSILSYGLAKRHIVPIETALEAQSRFTADASHELRTPLTVMQTEIEVSLRDKKLKLNDAKDQLTSNLEEVVKLRDLSDRLLKLARDDKDIKLGKVNYQTVVKNAIDQIELLAVGKNIMLDNQSGNIFVTANQQQLEDVVIILLDNAVKYSPTQTTVTITSNRRGHYGFLSVSDRGQGIKSKDLPHIFERFYQADHSRSNDKTIGYGLGLSIAKKLISSQGGGIEVKSEVKKGSSFTIKLPLAVN